MLGEYKVSRCTRQCHAEQRPLRDGEWYYSVVLESGDDFARQDYSAGAWEGPPEGAIGWWKCRMPKSDEKKMVLAPPEVLVDLLRQMEGFPDRAKSRYLLALMLMRRRIVRPAAAGAIPESESESGVEEQTNQETDETDGGENGPEQDVLWVEVVADGSVIGIPSCTVTRSESEKLKDELNELLYCEAEEE